MGGLQTEGPRDAQRMSCYLLLLGNTPKDQCVKVKTQENFILKLKMMGEENKKVIWNDLLCDTEYNRSCWLGLCDVSKNGKLYVPEIKSKTKYHQCIEGER